MRYTDLEQGELLSPDAAYISDAEDFRAFVQRVADDAGFDLSGYKQNQLRRRLNAVIQQAGYAGYCAYLDSVQRDTESYRRFLDRITINVSEFFRNPERFAELREHYLGPWLAEGHVPRLWSAGCSSGEEAYSLALLLEELQAPPEAMVLGWDIDQTALEAAERGRYAPDALLALNAEQRARYLRPLAGGGFAVGPELRRRVRFTRGNLLGDEFPPAQDVVLCRNVAIYLRDEAKADLYARLAVALSPRGVLLIGNSERIGHPAAAGLFSPRAYFYQRAGPG
jgi:chemotaxis protein methyltransferase CheR